MKMRFILIFAAVAFLCSVVLNVRSSMVQTNQTKLAQGKWGGTDVSMTVGEASADLQFACAEGEITGPIEIKKDNSFKADGTYSRRGPGPVREGDAGKPAEYIGHLSGDQLTLKIVLKSDNTAIGEFVLQKGRSVRIHRCL